MTYLLVILLYCLALVVIGIVYSRKVSSQEDFSVAGRQLSPLVLFGTMVATWIGTGSIFGNAERTYEVGIAAIIIPLASIFGVAVLSQLAGRVRIMEQITIQDLLEKRYNAAARVFGVVTLIIAYLTIVSYQYRAAGHVLRIVWPGELSVMTANIIAASFIIIYTALAGMKSIANIGLIQGITMIVGIMVTLPMFWFKAGGVEGMRQVLDSSQFDLIGPISFIGALNLLLPSFLLILGDANMYQRFNSAKSAGVARKAVWWSLIGIGFMEVAIIVTAWVASALEPNLSDHGRVIAFAAKDHLPVAVGALMLTTIMAIVLSTAGSYLLAPATCFVRDLFQRFISPSASEGTMVILLRVTVVAMGLAAFLLSTLSDKFLEVALLAYTIYGVGITPALLACFFWKRATAAGAVASIVTGTVGTLLWKYYLSAALESSMDAVLPGIAASLLALVVVSLATRPTPEERVKPFFQDDKA